MVLLFSTSLPHFAIALHNFTNPMTQFLYKYITTKQLRIGVH